MWLFIISIILVKASHYVGDFVCQNRWMGDNKSKRWLPLLAHGLAYTATMYAILLPSFLILSLIFPAFLVSWFNILIYVLCNGSLHIVIDYFSSRMSSKAWMSKEIGKFWKIIGADQLVHDIKLIISLGIYMSMCLI